MCVNGWMCVDSAKDKCINILQEARTLGFTDSISEGKLANIIINNRGVVCQRAIDNWTRALIAFGLIEEKAPHVYKINNRTET